MTAVHPAFGAYSTLHIPSWWGVAGCPLPRILPRSRPFKLEVWASLHTAAPNMLILDLPLSSSF